MKAVIFVLFAALVAVNAQTYQQCSRTPEYQEKIDPLSCPTATIKLPNYENAQTYYQCTQAGSKVTPGLVTCPNGQYFSYVLQGCQACESYYPTTQCTNLPIGATCVPMASDTNTTTTTTTTTTQAPGTTTTTTAAPAPADSTTTTTAMPQPPTEGPPVSTATPGDDGVITPSGTTVNVPQPPSPGESNIPTPVTPVPTAPIINNGPPVVTEAPTTN